MANVSSGNLRKQEVRLEKYLAGERTSGILCTTCAVAKILMEKYPEVKLVRRERVDKKLGLFIYLVRKK